MIQIMKIATWNVNSITARLPHVLQWLDAVRPDVLCVQETKCPDERFPVPELAASGYQAVFYGQPTYNGVAFLTRHEVTDIVRGLPGDATDTQARLLAATIGGIQLINVYVPNGAAVGSDKYQYKLAWLQRLRRFLSERYERTSPVLLCGDFNVAPEDRDVHDPKAWAGHVMVSKTERKALQLVKDWGFVDIFRQFHSESGYYSWWDYRSGGFPQNRGLRIDHIWVTPSLAMRGASVSIARETRGWERPSDHAPVVAEFTL